MPVLFISVINVTLNLLLLLFCIHSQAPEAIIALITHAAVRQIIESNLSGYRQDESEDACE